MSPDDKDDVTEEEASEEPEEEVEPEAEEEDEDTLFGEVEVPEGGGGCSAGTWVVIVIILAALVALGVWSVKKSHEQEKARQAEERAQARQTQLRDVAKGIADAERSVQQEDMADVLKALKGIDEKLSILHSAATQQRDTEAAAEIRRLRSAVSGAVGDIDEKYTELEEVAAAGVAGVRRAFSQYAPPAPAPPDEAAEAEATGGEAAEEAAAEEEAAEEEVAGEAAEDAPPEEGATEEAVEEEAEATEEPVEAEPEVEPRVPGE